MSNIITLDQEKTVACEKEIQETLNKYGMKFDPSCTITLTGFTMTINIVPVTTAMGSPGPRPIKKGDPKNG